MDGSSPIQATRAPPMALPQSDPKPKSDTSAKSKGSTSSTNARPDKPQKDYEVTGEGLREAIKNGDTAGVKKLLNEGVDANYHDKQGMSVLHLAVLFNQTDIALMLMEHGASLDYKNAQGRNGTMTARSAYLQLLYSRIDRILEQCTGYNPM
ncbi:hypothetical protein F2Q68_00027496 [Brassica cretica]|uniref:Uncharacterized protein n=1 Tax=Brassica cretica TaxID=69181 RepID=A0A8S9I706_BRACR|nr:hypothetical protein F2Q68_00027496 [Brassica cretica]